MAPQLVAPAVDIDDEFIRMVNALNRRGFMGGVAGAALLGLAGCRSSDSATPGDPESSGGFPVTVEDAFGPVTIEGPPRTVVSVGRTDHDALLALGVVPAALYRFVPSMERGVGPWAVAKLGDASPAILANPVKYEVIAELAPDLIFDVQSFADEAQHSALSRIATTVGLPTGATPNAVPWPQSTEFIATALGRRADGQRLVATTESYLSERAAANPGLAGKTVAVVLAYGAKVGVYTAGDTRMQLLTALGLAPADYVKNLGDSAFFAEISPERLSEVAADVVVVLSQEGRSTEQLATDFPTLATVPGYDDGKVVVVEDLDVALALSAASVLSIPYAVAALEPLLAPAAG